MDQKTVCKWNSEQRANTHTQTHTFSETSVNRSHSFIGWNKQLAIIFLIQHITLSPFILEAIFQWWKVIKLHTSKFT